MLRLNKEIRLFGIIAIFCYGNALGNSISHKTCEVQLISKPATVIDAKESINKLDLIKNNQNLMWTEADEKALEKKGYTIKKDFLVSEQAVNVEIEQEADLNNHLLAVKNAIVSREFRSVFAGEGYTKFDCKSSVKISNGKDLKTLFESDGDEFYKISYTNSNIPKECIELKSNLEGLPDCKVVE